jgi:hypothetical protein
MVVIDSTVRTICILLLACGFGHALPSINAESRNEFIGLRNHPGDGLRLLGMDGRWRNSTLPQARQLNSNSDIKRYTIKNILRGGKLDGFTSELVDNLAAIDHFESLLCTSRSAIARAFRSIDSDDSGHINMAELQSALADLGVNATASEVETIFDGLDENKDGSIDFEVPSPARTAPSCPVPELSRISSPSPRRERCSSDARRFCAACAAHMRRETQEADTGSPPPRHPTQPCPLIEIASTQQAQEKGLRRHIICISTTDTLLQRPPPS